MQTTGAGESNVKLDLLLDSNVLVSLGSRHSWFGVFHASLAFYDERKRWAGQQDYCDITFVFTLHPSSRRISR